MKAALFVAKAVAKGPVEAGLEGSIVIVSSQTGHVGGPRRAVYCASRHAVEGFTKAMALEPGPRRIRGDTVRPTFIRTALTEATLQDCTDFSEDASISAGLPAA